MKQVYFLLFSLFFLASSAQVMNRVETDCQSNNASIYGVLAQGKALIVISNGLDCSICVSKAPSWGNWSSNNSAKVEVWGAMTYTYSNAIATCNSMSNWVNDHNWNSIFTFADSTEYYFQSGTPRYLVYDPKDSSLIYQGGSESQARNLALGASSINLSATQYRLEDLSFYQSRGSLHFNNLPSGNTYLEIYNLTGRKEKTYTLRKDHKVLNISDLPKGIYLMRMSNANSALTRKIVIS